MFTKETLRDASGVAVGLKYLLQGKIGYGTPDQEMEELVELMTEIESLSTSELIVFDVTGLDRWDTLALKQIFPRVLQANEQLIRKHKVPISFVGPRSKDPYGAARERYPDVGSKKLPWFESLEGYKDEFHVDFPQ